MEETQADHGFPCSLTIHIPFPSNRLATIALGTLSVDEELSPLVRRSFSLVEPVKTSEDRTSEPSLKDTGVAADVLESTVLSTEYRATTNRMLRVAVNGFFESLGVVVQTMEELDVDVLHENGLESLDGAQGVEQGMTGTTLTGA